MNLKLKLLKKIVSLILAVLLFTNPLVVPVVYAEGEDNTPPPTEEVTPPPDESIPPAEENTPPPDNSQTIDTGDAGASTELDATVNDNEDTVPNPPDSSVGIGNTNQADVSNDLDSSANTGKNTEGGSFGDATITTGDATASGDLTSDVNSNTVTATSSSDLTEPTDSPDETSGGDEPSQTLSETSDEGSGTSAPETTVTISNENDGSVTNNADVSANTGGNVASENLGDADLKSGDATAWLNLLNFLNTNIVGSNFELMVLDVNENDGELDLNALWEQLQKQNSSDSVFLVGDESNNLKLLVNNNNDADLQNNVTVCATTGENEANQNDTAEVDTGDASALANIINMVNTNILGSKFFFGIVNITGQFTGNIILPRPETFANGNGSAIGSDGTVFENENSANLADTLAALANSGGNTENNNDGGSAIDTGSATAVTTDLSLVNLNLYGNDWFYLLLNILGNWDGGTNGWTVPGVTEEIDGQSQSYEVGSQEPSGVGSSTDTTSVDFENQNEANVENNVTVLASTGNNEASENRGGASINTGDAKAILNLLNLVNLNILSSNWFMGLINVLGSWSGNVIFAYPDLAVNLSGSPDEVSPGETFEYVLNYTNQGYDDAENVLVKMDFPRGIIYEGDNSGLQVSCSSQNCSWDVGNLGRNQSGSFIVRVKLDPNFLSLSQVSFFQKLIPQVYAAEESSSFIVKASVTTIVPESDNNNNVSERLTGVKDPARGGEGDAVDQRLPVLEITAKNNVNDFVYPKDIITFEITVKNTGEVRAENVYLAQALYNGVPADFGVARLNIGTIEPGKTAKITFGITLNHGMQFHAGSYHSSAKAIGYAPNGVEVSSNEARTDFKIKLKEVASLFEARAAGKEEETQTEDHLLGAASNCPVPQENIFPYVLLFILSSLWIVERSKRLSKAYLLK